MGNLRMKMKKARSKKKKFKEDSNEDKKEDSNEDKKENSDEDKKEDSDEEDDRVKEYKDYCKNLKFISDGVTVKVNETFAAKYRANYTIPPDYWDEQTKYLGADEGIILIEQRRFYPYPIGWTGGDDVNICVFKATKEGNFKIRFNTHDLNIKVEK